MAVSLNPMEKKRIYIYSPSGAVRDKAAFNRGVKRLQLLGHDVEVDPDALTSFQRFAGDDATRLASIHRAAASGAYIAMIARGGYGLTRILGGMVVLRFLNVTEGADLVSDTQLVLRTRAPALKPYVAAESKRYLYLQIGEFLPVCTDEVSLG